MTYYDELGVGPGASADEIRRAYRHQIKVFHPDLQHDDGMRARSEAKVRRLNEIVEVLADPEQRRAYDHELLLRFRTAVPEPRSSPVWARKPIWAAAALCLAALLGIALPGDPPLIVEEGTKLHPPAGETRRPRVAAPVRRVVLESDKPEPRRSETRPDPKPRARTDAAESSPPEPSHSMAPSRTMETAQVPPPPAASAPPDVKAKVSAESRSPSPTAENPLAGTWLFQPARGDSAETKLYPPKYIELRIESDAGKLFGRYRSTYEVHDQALSPNVNFNFQGPVAGSRARANWMGPGGARGSVELELLSPMNLRVNWKAEETGPGLDLVAGTAVLVKRLEN